MILPMKCLSVTVLALALFSSAVPASAGTAGSGRGVATMGDSDGYRYYFRSDGRPRRYEPEERWTVRIGAGMPSDQSTSDFLRGIRFGSRVPELASYYMNYHGPTVSSGAYSIGVEYLVARWFSVSADLNVEVLGHDLYDSVTDRRVGRAVGTALVFMPQAKILYMNRPMVRLYGYIGMGVVKYFGFSSQEKPYRDESGVRFEASDDFHAAIQFVPIGLEVGHRFFGFVECGSGFMFTGARGGVGYRF